MRSWSDLENEFRTVDAPYHDARLDYQWGAAGEYWRIAGVAPSPTVRRFEALARIAGAKLLQSSTNDDEELLDEANDIVRWYRALVKLSGSFNYGTYATQIDDNGEPAGNIYTGSVPQVAQASANLCLILEGAATSGAARGNSLIGHRYAGPRSHWLEAQRLAELDEPNWPGAVHEIVSAVEGMARLVLSDSDITLGRAVDVLRGRGKLHPALAKALDAIWGYSSAVPGIRHGAAAEVSVSPAEARFAFEVSAAALKLLEEIDRSTV